MSEIIQIKRVVVSATGQEFESPGAFRRHEYQKSIGAERTRISIAKVPVVVEEEVADEDVE